MTERRSGPTLAVVGATGAVGEVLLGLLSERADVWGEIRLIASPRSAGGLLSVRGTQTELLALSEDVFDGVDVALFNVPDEVAAQWVPVAVSKGAAAVDSSTVFRGEPDVPLVVPEVNAHAARVRPRGIVASPHSTTLAMIVAVAALHSEWALEELLLSSYQAVSGSGRAGVATLRGQLSAVSGMELGQKPGDLRRAVGDATGPYPAPIALNVVPFVGELAAAGVGDAGGGTDGAEGPDGADGAYGDDGAGAGAAGSGTGDGEDDAEAVEGWTTEELRLRGETRKILGLPRLAVGATCVRVPVITGHSVSVHARFEREVSVAGAHEILANAPGVVLCDDPEQGEFPTPADVAGTDPTWVGRVRRALDDPRALDLFVCGDNLRKGAALNSVQIAELIAAELRL
ncbi:Asd/ArgC dimerization domain-containing protein [Streptomyces sp. ODS28]|uniref:aspartate-semialdehyde dehydrogenase n=1 Tax=Streptomyces sp. ODS28 TaxID=3136688 RepID=UPI0031F1BCE2